MLKALRNSLAKSQSPAEKAYNYFIEGILSGELQPGMRIPTEGVAEMLGISRMPVRDALQRLAGDGVVTIFANRGASIAEYSPSDVAELIEMRAALEGLGARMALENMNDSALEELEHLKNRMERNAGDLTKWIACHDEFHNYLTSISGRPLLMQQTERMRLMMRPYFRRYYAESRELEILGLEHDTIIDAVRKNDPEFLERTVRAHARANVTKIASFAVPAS